MNDMTSVTGPSSPLEGRSAKVIAVVVIAVVVALIKPWNSSAPPPIARATPGAPTPSPTPASPTPFDPFANYDHELFGIYEPAARWELWPAGYVDTFGFAMRIDSAGADLASTSSEPASPGASGGPSAGQPIWPARINLTAGGHLSMVGINTPLGFTITWIWVSRLEEDGAETPIAIVYAPSRWPEHFTVIGMDDGNQEPRESWPPGRYRLDLAIDPGGIVRSVELDVGQTVTDPGGPSAAPTPRQRT